MGSKRVAVARSCKCCLCFFWCSESVLDLRKSGVHLVRTETVISLLTVAHWCDLTVCLSLFLNLSGHLFLSLSRCVFLSVSVCLFLCWSVCLYLSQSVSLWLQQRAGDVNFFVVEVIQTKSGSVSLTCLCRDKAGAIRDEDILYKIYRSFKMIFEKEAYIRGRAHCKVLRKYCILGGPYVF